MNLREDVCIGSAHSSAQERLLSLKENQSEILTTDLYSKQRTDCLKMIQKGAAKFKMTTQTVQLAMTYFDIMVNAAPHMIQKPWQLHAITCMTLACKFQERDDNVPLIGEIIKYLVGVTA